MGLLYKEPKDVTLFLDIKQQDGKVELDFTADCGKFGTIEQSSVFTLTIQRLREILENNDDYTDQELDYLPKENQC